MPTSTHLADSPASKFPPPTPPKPPPPPPPAAASQQSEDVAAKPESVGRHSPGEEGNGGEGGGVGAGNGGHVVASGGGKARRKPQPQPPPPPVFNPEELSSMIQSKIVQLETESSVEEEEEKAIARAIKKASRDMSLLIEGADHQQQQHQQAGTDKLDLVHSRYMDLFQDHKRLEREFALMKRKLDQANKEKDSLKADNNKINTQKQKLETVCRELQKENKRVKEDSKRLSVSEQHKRDELSSKFESTIWEIKTKMEADSEDKRLRTLAADQVKDKFRSFLHQYELREQHYGQMLRSRDIEIQLLEARLEQRRQAGLDEAGRIMTMGMQLRSFVKTEGDLRRQLGIYVDKFRQVEDTLQKSNDLFLTFRKEMEQMTKKSRKLEKDNAAVRAKCERMNHNIIEMAEERTKACKSVETAHAGQAKLEKLCRALQTERNSLRKRLEDFEARLAQLDTSLAAATATAASENASAGAPSGVEAEGEKASEDVSAVEEKSEGLREVIAPRRQLISRQRIPPARKRRDEGGGEEGGGEGGAGGKETKEGVAELDDGVQVPRDAVENCAPNGKARTTAVR
ncbi:myosin-like coiled-coil protein-domain-containing protein [Geranomyces variabilis]|nr:myosin-like coiled-coil protein-domain-containing protein [Geranomyces variabilis]KAJ3132238.1 hypothetical protein HDU90_007430 [Geranomyces variabilis]